MHIIKKFHVIKFKYYLEQLLNIFLLFLIEEILFPFYIIRERKKINYQSLFFTVVLQYFENKTKKGYRVKRNFMFKLNQIAFLVVNQLNNNHVKRLQIYSRVLALARLRLKNYTRLKSVPQSVDDFKQLFVCLGF